ncbi:MAG: hypothetical protein WD250_14535 [Egibacteraceae bacterium]
MAVGGVMVGLFPLLHPAHDAAGYASAAWAPVHLLPHVGLILIMAGLPRLVLRHRVGGGRLLRVGTAVAYVGMALTLAQAMVEAFVFPLWAVDAPERLTSPPPVGAGVFMGVGSLAFLLGFVLLGIAIARTRALPTYAGVLVALGGPAFGLGGAGLGLAPVFVTGGLLLGAGLLWLGVALKPSVREG